MGIKDPGEPQVNRSGKHAVHHPRRGQNLQRSRLHRSSPGLPVRAGLTLDNPGPHPPAGELHGRKQPRRPGTYHQHLD
jgi:hypothetical protein